MNSSTDVAVGRVRRAHGLRGEVVVEPLTDHPERFEAGSSMLTEDGAALVVATVRPHGDGLLIRFEGIADRTGAESLRGKLLVIDVGLRRPLERDEYWPDDLVGLEVRDGDGMVCGTVVDVVTDALQDRLVIDRNGRRVEIPFVVDLVPEVRLDAGYLVIAPIPGLLGESGTT